MYLKSGFLNVLNVAFFLLAARSSTAQPSNPILFVTQVPVPADFTTIGSTFGNHQGSLSSAARGGDLWIRYPDGTLRNLTQEAGYGSEGFQSENAIAVREPAVHWDGNKAVFSMVIGAPTRRYQVRDYYWQLYEIIGLQKGDTPVITRVPGQPDDFNNISPTYGTDDRIIFTSDRPRNGARHLYPQLDEYEEAPTVTGLWSLDPETGGLFIMSHTPSGAFSPLVDSYGRVIFTRWDHLQRDQQADADAGGNNPYGTFDYSDESADAQRLFDVRIEVFPEPRTSRTDLLNGTNLEGHRFNSFFPWMINEDGTEEETLNHIGRHELHSYFNRTFNDDPEIDEFIFVPEQRLNQNSIENFFQIKESPTQPGLYFGIDAPEFATHSAGQITTIYGPPTLNADEMTVGYITHKETGDTSEDPSPNHSGLYRSPVPLENGTMIAVHTPETRADRNDGSRTAPTTRYDFRIKTLKQEGDYLVPDAPLTAGITKSIRWWDPDQEIVFNGELWELDPVEVRPRLRPERRTTELGSPEKAVLLQEQVEEEMLRDYLFSNDLALLISRDVTTRDQGDRQQPFNLRVADSETETTGTEGRVYDISHLQFFQGDQLRGIGLHSVDGEPRQGRRVIARELHDPSVKNPPLTDAPSGSVQIGDDGSMAAFVPARRALSWQLTSPAGEPVVRERYWLTFQPGEIRTCASCHGLNREDQASQGVPQNEPKALASLLRYWKESIIKIGGKPRARIHRKPDGSIEVRWPVDEQNVVVETTFELDSPDWQRTNVEPEIVDGQFVFPVDTSIKSRFFRLTSPE